MDKAAGNRTVKAAEVDSHTGAAADPDTDGMVVEETVPVESGPDIEAGNTAVGNTAVDNTAAGYTVVGKSMLPAGSLPGPKQPSFEDIRNMLAGSTGTREGRSSNPPSRCDFLRIVCYLQVVF